jgi:hypothetical protein
MLLINSNLCFGVQSIEPKVLEEEEQEEGGAAATAERQYYDFSLVINVMS